MLLTPLGPGLAVKVLKPLICHCRVEASEQVWRFRWGAARVKEVRERTGRRGKCMVSLCVGWGVLVRFVRGYWDFNCQMVKVFVR